MRSRRLGSIRALVVTALGLTIWAAPALAQTTAYLPQLADGGGYTSTFYFTGLGTGPASVTIDFFQPNGSALSLQTNRGTGTTFTTTIPATGEISIATLGRSASVQVGWARATSSIPIGITEVFQLFDNPFGFGPAARQASVLPSDAVSTATIFAALDGRGTDTGIAIANVGLSSSNVTLTLYDQSGSIVGVSTVSLGPLNVGGPVPPTAIPPATVPAGSAPPSSGGTATLPPPFGGNH